MTIKPELDDLEPTRGSPLWLGIGDANEGHTDEIREDEGSQQ